METEIYIDHLPDRSYIGLNEPRGLMNTVYISLSLKWFNMTETKREILRDHAQDRFKNLRITEKM